MWKNNSEQSKEVKVIIRYGVMYICYRNCKHEGCNNSKINDGDYDSEFISFSIILENTSVL